jgi:putative phage-type endonuclease
MDIDTDIGADIGLVNIIDSITAPSMFTPEEEIDLIDTAYSLLNDLLEAEPMLYIQPCFHEYVIIEVTELLLDQLEDVIAYCNEEEGCEEEIELCVEQAMKLFYQQVAPKRSFNKTFILNNNIKRRDHIRVSQQINYLQNVPQPEQRTPEWYNFRYKYLTASSIWKAFISESTRNQLIFDKCKPLNVEKYSHTSLDSPMHWGHKYEPVSVQLYEALYNTQVSDFGCIPHKTLEFLAASPDGINTLTTSERYGRMLEIKNIVNRDIDGIPKIEYWIQMQLQLEVCDLEECDFLETRFKEYLDEEAYFADEENDTDNAESDVGSLTIQQKGVMIQFMVNGQPLYEYAPLNINRADLLKWEEAMMDKHANDVWGKNIYWRLDELSCVLVLRNKFWFKAAVPILTDLWKTIEYEKVNGYQHRSPNKKIKLENNNNVLAGKCFIDLSTFMDVDKVEEEKKEEEDNLILNIETDVFIY